jgi:hypothetical protein
VHVPLAGTGKKETLTAFTLPLESFCPVTVAQSLVDIELRVEVSVFDTVVAEVVVTVVSVPEALLTVSVPPLI